MIQCILLLQEFNFEVNARKGYENLVVNHLSLLESNNAKLGETDISENFTDDLVMDFSRGVEP